MIVLLLIDRIYVPANNFTKLLPIQFKNVLKSEF